jgi:hypothetical protein
VLVVIVLIGWCVRISNAIAQGDVAMAKTASSVKNSQGISMAIGE